MGGARQESETAGVSSMISSDSKTPSCMWPAIEEVVVVDVLSFDECRPSTAPTPPGVCSRISKATRVVWSQFRETFPAHLSLRQGRDDRVSQRNLAVLAEPRYIGRLDLTKSSRVLISPESRSGGTPCCRTRTGVLRPDFLGLHLLF